MEHLYRPAAAALSLPAAAPCLQQCRLGPRSKPASASSLSRHAVPPLHAAARRPGHWWLASVAPPPTPDPLALHGLSPEEEEESLEHLVEEESWHLALDLATVISLPPEEEVALLGMEPMRAPPRIDPAALPQPLLVLSAPPEERPDATPCTFYILGTAHISAQSCADVAKLIRAVQPHFVFLELCKERAAMLGPSVTVRAPTWGEAAALVRSGKATPFAILYSWLLARVGAGIDVTPGEEFRVALAEGRAIGARYVLGDRPVSITMARMWAALSFMEKARLMASLLHLGSAKVAPSDMRQEIERLKEVDVLAAAVAQFGRTYPHVLGPLVAERDRYMVLVLRKLAAYGDRVVAVVGAGHLDGIRKHWNDEIDLEELTRLPRK